MPPARKPPASMLKARHHGSGELLLAEPAIDRDRERDRDRDRDRDRERVRSRSRDRDRERDRERSWSPSRGDSYIPSSRKSDIYAPSRDKISSKSSLSSFRARDRERDRDRGRDRDRWDRRDSDRRELARDRRERDAGHHGGVDDSPMQISRSPSPVVSRAHRNKRREEVAEKLAANGMDYLKIEGLRLGKDEGEKGVREVLGEFYIDQVRFWIWSGDCRIWNKLADPILCGSV